MFQKLTTLIELLISHSFIHILFSINIKLLIQKIIKNNKNQEKEKAEQCQILKHAKDI